MGTRRNLAMDESGVRWAVNTVEPPNDEDECEEI
jgi:hypothetical protein